jgi:hypothetical protein
VTWFIVAGTSIFLIPYVVFFLTRYVVRAELRKAISGQQFDVRLLPDTLEFGLRRVDLERVQFTDIATPEHQDEPRSPRGAVRVRVNRAKLVLHILGCGVGIFLYVMLWFFLVDHMPYRGDGVLSWVLWVAGIAVTLFLGIVAAAAIAGIPVLAVALIRGGPLIVSSEGIADLLFNRKLGFLRWDQVIEASIDTRRQTLKLRVSNRDKAC